MVTASPSANTELGTGAVGENKIATGAVSIGKIADSVIVTNSEQSSHSVDDNTFFTTSAADARYFNISSGDTIKDGDSFPDNDTSIATTAAINDRIIDIVDDIGGFVPLVDEGEAYKRRLLSFGNEVHYRLFPGQMHAFVSNSVQLPTALICIKEMSEAANKIFSEL